MSEPWPEIEVLPLTNFTPTEHFKVNLTHMLPCAMLKKIKHKRDTFCKLLYSWRKKISLYDPCAKLHRYATSRSLNLSLSLFIEQHYLKAFKLCRQIYRYFTVLLRDINVFAMQDNCRYHISSLRFDFHESIENNSLNNSIVLLTFTFYCDCWFLHCVLIKCPSSFLH